jgi:hypothetical protein
MSERYLDNCIKNFVVHVNSSLPKVNENPIDCQDSTAIDIVKQRFCISDGATQSFYPNLWSRILCEEYCSFAEDINRANWREWLAIAQQRWHQSILDKREALHYERKVSWIECSNAIALKKPAFATFLGLTLRDEYIRGIAIGDSFALDIELADQTDLDSTANLPYIHRIIPGLWNPSFSNRTEGLSSYQTESPWYPEFFEIPIRPNKKASWIFMMTDALAAYTLNAEKNGNSILPRLTRLATPDEFKELVDKLRDDGLANDDTTLVTIQLGEASLLKNPNQLKQDTDNSICNESRNLHQILPATEKRLNQIPTETNEVAAMHDDDGSHYKDLLTQSEPLTSDQEPPTPISEPSEIRSNNFSSSVSLPNFLNKLSNPNGSSFLRNFPKQKILYWLGKNNNK